MKLFISAALLGVLLVVTNTGWALPVTAVGEAQLKDINHYRTSYGLAELPDGSWGVHASVHYRPHWSRRWRRKSFIIPFTAEYGKFTVRGDALFLSANNDDVEVAEKRSMQPIRWHTVGDSVVSCQETKNGRTLILSKCMLKVN